MSRPRWCNLLIFVAASIITLVGCEGFFALTGILKPSAPIYPGENMAVKNHCVDALIGWKLPASQ